MNMESKAKWYEHAVMYQVHIRAFYDSNGDGHGDLPGITQKLDYIKSLGVDCIWLMPMYPSPLVDDGYDVADYRNINPQFGTLEDFKALCDEVHKRDMKLLVDFVVNHTSDQHHWFKEARKSLDSPYRDYYVWSDTGQEYSDIRVIFSDTEISNWHYDELTGQYYWHRFYNRQPDLNYDNPKVQEEMLNVVRYWLDMGVDGFRVDATPYLFEREGTECESLPETHQFYKDMRKVLETEYSDKVMMSESSVPREKQLEYFGDSDEFQLIIHFHFAAVVFAILAVKTREPILEVIEYITDNPPNTQWATYLRSHDALATSLLSDRYLKRTMKRFGSAPNSVFAGGEIRRRINAMIDDNLDEWRLAYAILYSFPGSPILYYGDEIGLGDDLRLMDRFPCRMPMQWNAQPQGGFSTAAHTYLPAISKGDLSYHKVNVEQQEADPNSRLNIMRKLINTYKNTDAFRSAGVTYIDTANKFVLGYERKSETQTVRCLFNLRPFPQAVDMELIKGTRDILGLDKFDPQSSVIPPNAIYWLEVTE